jgi:hypothetical protein
MILDGGRFLFGHGVVWYAFKEHKDYGLTGCEAVYFDKYVPMWGPLMVAQWLRCCATNRKVAGSIPDDVIGFFH